MGLIKAIVGATGGSLADSWREYFYCDALDQNTLAVKGRKRTSSKGRSSNTKGEDNIISNGSVIAVADGQCMIIVEQGEIVDVCAEPGEFTYDSSTEPSLFYGKLGENIKATFSQIGRRFTFGGDTGKDQRVYYFNTKEIVGNKYGTTSPIPFRVVDRNIGLDLDAAVRCNGEYSYKLVDPLLFYKNVCGNVEEAYTRDKLEGQMRSELLTAMQPALAKISALGVRYSEVPAHTAELAGFLNEELSAKWVDLRGIRIESFGMNAITLSEEDQKRIKDLQSAAIMRDPNMAAANIAAAQSDALRNAASNEAGAATGFMGMGMAGALGGMNASQLFEQGAERAAGQAANAGATTNVSGAPGQEASTQTTSANKNWFCPQCGTANDGKFCTECGTPKPAPASWTCSCGTNNSGKFCSNCGKPRP